MIYLIDTHVLIWYIDKNKKLSKKAISTIDNSDNQILISKASLWELAIKISIGKLKISLSFEGLENFLDEHNFTIDEHNFTILDYDFNHLTTLLTLPFHHKDPFDRLIISQAITDNITVITKDRSFHNYPIDIFY